MATRTKTIVRAPEVKLSAAEKREIARAEVEALRAQRKAEATTPVEPVAQPADKEPALNRLFAAANDLLGEGGIELPSGKRLVASVTLGFAVAFGTGYVVGYALNALLMGLAILAWPSFLLMAIAVLGLVLAAYVGGKFGTAAFSWLATKRADKQVTDARTKVLGWFKAEGSVQPAAAA